MTRIPALELRDVAYLAGGRKILDTINWKVQPGEHWRFLGPNGCGKTTLVRIASDYLWSNGGGEVFRKGRYWTTI